MRRSPSGNDPTRFGWYGSVSVAPVIGGAPDGTEMSKAGPASTCSTRPDMCARAGLIFTSHGQMPPSVSTVSLKPGKLSSIVKVFGAADPTGPTGSGVDSESAGASFSHPDVVSPF